MKLPKAAGRILAIALVSLLILPGISASGQGLPTLLGLYPSGGLAASVGQIQAMDAWLGVDHSIAATFIDLEDFGTTVEPELNAAWINGYTPFVNLTLPPPSGSAPEGGAVPMQEVTAPTSCPLDDTAEGIANGSIDAEVRAFAQAYAVWSGGGKWAFIAPLHEMNGYWYCYGNNEAVEADPANYRKAYLRIQQLFLQEGVAEDAVVWVFHPNGQSEPGWPPFEAYYPGNAYVDVVSFSAYNWGGCSPFWNGGDAWKTPEDLYGPYLARLRAMAPGKPIFVAETGTSSYERGDQNTPDPALKDSWLAQAYDYLDSYDAVRGILYFNYDFQIAAAPNPCDFALDVGTEYGGLADVVQDQVNNGFAAFTPDLLKPFLFPRPPGAFEDVWPVHPFAGVDPAWYASWVQALKASGLTAGYAEPPVTLDFPALGLTVTLPSFTYRPYNLVSRAEMAVFLKKGIHGSSYTPPAPNGSHPFSDLAGHWAEAWMEELYDEGMTVGYPDGTYRPENQVTRAEMAVFLLKAKYGSSYFAPVPDGGSFTDVAGQWAESWIEQLKEEGITSGYPDGTYRPENQVTRDEMAVFLVRAFSLPYP